MALDWRILLGFAMIVASYVFRIEVVRFTLGLLRRALPNLVVWIRQFEKMLLRPLSWVVFVLLMWGSLAFMGIENWLHTDKLNNNTIGSIGVVCLGISLVWVVISFCNYLTWAIIKLKGWDGTKSRDDYSRVMIITETIAVIKILLVALVASGLILGELADMTGFDTTEITLVAVMCLEVILVLGGHTWSKNVMGGLILLIDEQIKSGVHIRFQGREGVVEQMYLQSFSLRQYDKALVFFPTGILLENSVEIQTKVLERRCSMQVHLSHKTTSTQIRLFIQKIDTLLWHKFDVKDTNGFGKSGRDKDANDRNGTVPATNSNAGKGANLIRLVEHKYRHPVDFFGLSQDHKLNAMDESNRMGATRFWVSMVDAFVVEVVYYTQERHISPRLKEKTEVTLSVIQVLEDMNLHLHEDDDDATPVQAPIQEEVVHHKRVTTMTPQQTVMRTASSDISVDDDPFGLLQAARDGSILRLRKRTEPPATN